MPYVDFAPLKELKPGAVKLWLYFLDQVEQTGKTTCQMSLAELGEESGLQSATVWRWTHQAHGNDGRLRIALEELIEKGFIEKQGGRRGRRPNTYRVVKRPPSPEGHPSG